MNNETQLVQKILFEQYMDPIRLKAGKDKCPCCGRLMKSYCKSMDKRLVWLLCEIVAHLAEKNRQRGRLDRIKKYNIHDVFNNDYRKICDADKLHYWGLIEECGGGYWELTRKGEQFFLGEIQLPKRIWVFNDKIVEQEDVCSVHVGNADERWQKTREDYTRDYIPQKYQLDF